MLLPDTLDPLIRDLLTDPAQFAKQHHSYPIPLDQLCIILSETRAKLQAQPNFIVLPETFSNTLIIGDIHGDLISLGRILRSFLHNLAYDPKAHSPQSMIFLGDYIDRGSESFLTFLTILILFHTWPDRICILRGNHEQQELHRLIGPSTSSLEKKIRKRYYKLKDSILIRNLCHSIIDNLPWAAMTPQKSLCLHGGVPCGLSQIQIINEEPKSFATEQSLPEDKRRVMVLMDQIIWNDPQEAMQDDFGPSDRGIEYKSFNHAALLRFLSNSGALRLIRAHESTRGAFQILFGGELIHIFSSEPYGGTIPIAYILWEQANQPTQLLTLDGMIQKSF